MNIYRDQCFSRDWVQRFRPFMIHRGDPFQGFAAAASGRNSKIMFDQFPNHGPNAITPDLMTPAERFREIGEILVAGLLRLKAHESIRSGSNRRDISLDFTANQSGHGRAKKRRERP